MEDNAGADSWQRVCTSPSPPDLDRYPDCRPEASGVFPPAVIHAANVCQSLRHHDATPERDPASDERAGGGHEGERAADAGADQVELRYVQSI